MEAVCLPCREPASRQEYLRHVEKSIDQHLPLYLRKKINDNDVFTHQDHTTCLLAFVALTHRYPCVAEHGLRVGELSVSLASVVAPQLPMEIVFWGGVLHDIGKSILPDGLLHKPGPLTDEERELFQRHPLFGERILFARGIHQTITRVALQHHERHDGSGYPERIDPASIHPISSIVSAADTYIAMREHRLYCSPQTHYSALDEIDRVCGTQLHEVYAEALKNLSLAHFPHGDLTQPLPRAVFTRSSFSTQRIDAAKYA